MDKFDFAILEELENNCRQSMVRLAGKVGLSKSPCWARVRELQQQEVILGFRAVVDQSALGLRLNAYVRVMLEFTKHGEFEAAVLKHPSIIECYTSAGDGDYILRIVASDVERLDRLLREDLSSLPGVQRTSSTICLKTIKDNGPLTNAARYEARATRIEPGIRSKR